LHRIVVVPITPARENSLRYDDWEYTRRLAVEKASGRKIGYVHLRTMGGGDMAQWQREFYPVFDRDGLIIEVRHNNGGNIDSWILEKLMRKVHSADFATLARSRARVSGSVHTQDAVASASTIGTPSPPLMPWAATNMPTTIGAKNWTPLAQL